MKNSLLLSFCVLFAACAQVVPPDGGPKDTTPPVIVSSEPDNLTTGFSGQSITLEFDEFVQMRNEHTQVIISPPLGTPEYRMRGRRLTIVFDSVPEPNTTYIINFGQGIVDYNEGNPLDSNIFVFSTGSYLDSLQVSGSVIMAEERTTEKDILVMLYRNMHDSVPYLQIPDYVGRTGASGNFRINYLRPGLYKVLALQDANNNYLYDDPEKEKIGFLNEPLVLRKDTAISLTLFSEGAPVQRIKNAEQPAPGLVTVIFSRPASRVTIESDKSFVLRDSVMEFNRRADTLSLWLPDAGQDTFNLIFSTPEMEADTHRITPAGSTKSRGRTAVPEKVVMRAVTEPNDAAPYDTAGFSFTASEPLTEVNPDSMLLIVSEDTLAPDASIEDLRTMRIRLTPVPDSSYTFVLLPGAVTGITGRTNDTTRFSLVMNPTDYYGNLSIQPVLSDSSHQYLLFLENSQGKVVQKDVIQSSERISYRSLPPGNYRFRLVYDTNGNGRWDTGNYLEGRQPEKLLIYSGAVNVRSNWDLDLDWDTEGSKKTRNSR